MPVQDPLKVKPGLPTKKLSGALSRPISTIFLPVLNTSQGGREKRKSRNVCSYKLQVPERKLHQNELPEQIAGQ